VSRPLLEHYHGLCLTKHAAHQAQATKNLSLMLWAVNYTYQNGCYDAELAALHQNYRLRIEQLPGDERLELQSEYEAKLCQLKSPLDELCKTLQSNATKAMVGVASAAAKELASAQTYELKTKTVRQHQTYGNNLWSLFLRYGLGVMLLQLPVLNLGYVGKCSEADITRLLCLLESLLRFCDFMAAVSGATEEHILSQSTRPETLSNARKLASFASGLLLDAIADNIEEDALVVQAAQADDDAESVD
jgi:hypothetical protein